MVGNTAKIIMPKPDPPLVQLEAVPSSPVFRINIHLLLQVETSSKP